MGEESFEQRLPLIICRNQIETFFPGISGKTLANLASQRKGPRYFKSGGLVFYYSKDVVAWLKSRSVIVSTTEQQWEEKVPGGPDAA
jgi:hypothetical protein